MQQFDHRHIIKLVGICSQAPIWIVMELARHGELRAYLVTFLADFLQAGALGTKFVGDPYFFIREFVDI